MVFHWDVIGKKGLWNKGLDPQASQVSTHPGQDPQKCASQPFMELYLGAGRTFKDPVLKKIYFEIAWKLSGREAASGFCPQIALD